jgi:hypothetical protein
MTNDAEPITIYVSMESSKDCSRTMANISWNIEEEFTTSYLSNFQLDNLGIHRADLLPAALRAATRCALRTTLLDSEPLLDLLGSLKNIAYVG